MSMTLSCHITFYNMVGILDEVILSASCSPMMHGQPGSCHPPSKGSPAAHGPGADNCNLSMPSWRGQLKAK